MSENQILCFVILGVITITYLIYLVVNLAFAICEILNKLYNLMNPDLQLTLVTSLAIIAIIHVFKKK